MFLSLVFVSAPKARAFTIDDLANQISSLVQQVSELKAELSAAVALSRTTTTIATTDTRTVTPTATTTVAPITTTRTVVPTTVEPKPTTGSTDISTYECERSGGSVRSHYCTGGYYDGWVVDRLIAPVVTPVSAKVIAPVINPTNPNPPVNAKTTVPENSTIPTNAKITFGMRNNANVKGIQQIFRNLGYLSNDSQVSGNFLGVTKTAIMQFQKDNGLKADGVLGTLSYDKLNRVIGLNSATVSELSAKKSEICSNKVTKAIVSCGSNNSTGPTFFYACCNANICLGIDTEAQCDVCNSLGGGKYCQTF